MAQNDPLLLLVEDNDYDVLVIQRAIAKSRLACHLEIVRDGQDALDFLFKTGEYKNRAPAGNPLLVLMDIKLPKLSGLEVLKTIRHNINTMNIPVVILSLFNDEPNIHQGYDLGANGFVWKTMDMGKFVENIQIVIRYWLILNQQPEPGPDSPKGNQQPVLTRKTGTHKRATTSQPPVSVRQDESEVR